MIFVYIILLFLGIISCEDLAINKDKGKANLENKSEVPDVVDVKLFYEVFCPQCINFESQQFEKVIQLLSPHLFIHTYPYGNAKTNIVDGKEEINCQHGPKECYGNTLHACTLRHIANHTEALVFNICMMGINGSDDAAAEECSRKLNVNISSILQCAKGSEGFQLLQQYGEESRKANFKHVPFVLVNGVQWNGTDFMPYLCGEFRNPPAACAGVHKGKMIAKVQ